MAEILSEPKRSIEAHLINVSGCGMGLRMGEALASDVAVRVACGDVTYLGEVCYCRKEAEGDYTIGLMIEHVLGAMPGLIRLSARLNNPSETPELRNH